MDMWQTYLRPPGLDEALALLDQHAGRARLIAGGTDVLVELPRGIKPTETLIDLTAVPGLRYVRSEGDCILLGTTATTTAAKFNLVCYADGTINPANDCTRCCRCSSYC